MKKELKLAVVKAIMKLCYKVFLMTVYTAAFKEFGISSQPLIVQIAASITGFALSGAFINYIKDTTNDFERILDSFES